MGNANSLDQELWKNKILYIDKQDSLHLPRNSYVYFVETSISSSKETKKQMILNAGVRHSGAEQKDVEVELLDSVSVAVPCCFCLGLQSIS